MTVSIVPSVGLPGGPITGIKTAPLPLLHGSMILTLGAVTYPTPLLTISIAMIVPF